MLERNFLDITYLCKYYLFLGMPASNSDALQVQVSTEETVVFCSGYYLKNLSLFGSFDTVKGTFLVASFCHVGVIELIKVI